MYRCSPCSLCNDVRKNIPRRMHAVHRRFQERVHRWPGIVTRRGGAGRAARQRGALLQEQVRSRFHREPQARRRRRSTGSTGFSPASAISPSASRPLEVSSFEVDGTRMAYVFYESGLSINVMYGIEDGSKRAVGFKLVRRYGRSGGAGVKLQVRAPKVKARRHHPRLLLRDQGPVLRPEFEGLSAQAPNYCPGGAPPTTTEERDTATDEVQPHPSRVQPGSEHRQHARAATTLPPRRSNTFRRSPSITARTWKAGSLWATWRRASNRSSWPTYRRPGVSGRRPSDSGTVFLPDRLGLPRRPGVRAVHRNRPRRALERRDRHRGSRRHRPRSRLGRRGCTRT